ncbi:MAG: hypothetical protein Q9176_000882 [Flavoplaca citrina]
MLLNVLQSIVCLNLISFTTSQQIASDPGRSGASLEIVHLYNDFYPQVIAVSSTGRKNQLPTWGAINYTTIPATGANYSNYLIGVQSVVIDPKDRLWILDTGRAATPEGVNVPSTPGGPKLIGIDLRNDTIFQTILFPPTVAYSDSYLNDIRFDLRPSVTASGQGIGYITDSSQEGRNGLVMVDFGTGESWRHLDNHTRVYRPGQINPSRLPRTSAPMAFALSVDGDTLFWTAVGSRTLYSIPTERLRDRSLSSEVQAQASVVSRGEKGISDGLETDSNGLIYLGNFENNAINVFNPANGTVSVFARDARIAWTDAFAIAKDGYIYFTENQLWRTKAYYPGTDRRVKPYVLFRAKLPGNGTKVNLQ